MMERLNDLVELAVMHIVRIFLMFVLIMAFVLLMGPGITLANSQEPDAVAESESSIISQPVSRILALISDNKLPEALRQARQLKNKPLVKAIKFLEYSDSSSYASFEEILEFVRHNPNFPDRGTLLRLAENKIKPTTNKAVLTAWCAKNSPQTGRGSHFCLETLAALPGADEKMHAQVARLARATWVIADYDAAEEREFLSKYGRLLSKQEHVDRINHLLEKNRPVSKTMLAVVDTDHEHLSRVKMLLAKRYRTLDPNSSVVDDIASHLRQDPYFLYLQATWYRSHKHTDKLKDLLLNHAEVRAIKSDRWFKLRSLLIWDLLDEQNYKTAYEIAAGHDYKDGTNYVDGEWLAGRIAYSYLNNSKLAKPHFRNILDSAKYSTSLAKGAYWSGIAAKDLGNKREAAEYFALGAQYLDTFYGQLCVMQLNGNQKCQHELKAAPQVLPADLQWFKNNELVTIGHLLAHAGRVNTSRKFIQAALISADTDGKKYLMGSLGDHLTVSHSLSTISGKEAARRGVLCLEHAYPRLKLGSIRVSADEALVHSIIRQESEFQPAVVSSAGATGLMQLMYPTAQEVSRKLKAGYVTKRSLKNPGFNIMLGSKCIHDLLERYNGSYVLAIAAYNAGEARADEWIQRFGDPRKLKTIEAVVEWIESTPFAETRGYIQNVLGNLQLYRNLIRNTGKPGLSEVHLDLGRDLLS